MAEKKISDMIEVSSLADTDMMVVRSGTATNKVSIGTLKSVLGGGGFAPESGSLSYDENQVTLTITPITGTIIED